MPKVIDNYVLEQKIGSGQFGDVFKGFNKDTRMDVAVKVIRRESLKGKFSELLENEIKVLKSCNNPNIIKLYDLRKTSNNFYLIMEYCNEGDLSVYVKRTQTLSERESIGFLRQILNAFKTLVKNKILHRDFKLANILKHNGELKIADFGFSKLLNNEDFTSTILGSPLHMAPEVIGGNEYNNKADIWSLGTVLYEMLFGRPPYTAANMVDLVNNIKNKPLVIPRNVNAISQATEDILRKMLVMDPQQRISWEELFDHQVLDLFKPQGELRELELKNGKVNEDISTNESQHQNKQNLPPVQPQFSGRKSSMKKQVQLQQEPKSEPVALNKKISVQNRGASKDKMMSPKELEDDKTTLASTDRQKDDAFKRNADLLLHYRNIYVFLASVAEDVISNYSMQSSELVGYLLVRKLLSTIQWLNDVMNGKSVLLTAKEWSEFTKEKDFKDIKHYIANEYEIFKTFHNNLYTRLTNKEKLSKYSDEIRDVILDQKANMDQLFAKKLSDYIRHYLITLRESKPKTIEAQKKKWTHLQRAVDCLDIDHNFQFQTGTDLFNFRQYYDSSKCLTIDEMTKRVQHKCKTVLI